MAKLKLGVIIGGMSTENEVSVVSGKNVLKNLDTEKYEVYPMYIASDGEWYEYMGKYDDLNMGKEVKDTQKIENIIKYLKELDVVFPVLHGAWRGGWNNSGAI